MMAKKPLSKIRRSGKEGNFHSLSHSRESASTAVNDYFR